MAATSSVKEVSCKPGRLKRRRSSASRSVAHDMSVCMSVCPSVLHGWPFVISRVSVSSGPPAAKTSRFTTTHQYTHAHTSALSSQALFCCHRHTLLLHHFLALPFTHVTSPRLPNCLGGGRGMPASQQSITAALRQVKIADHIPQSAAAVCDVSWARLRRDRFSDRRRESCCRLPGTGGGRGEERGRERERERGEREREGGERGGRPSLIAPRSASEGDSVRLSLVYA